MRAYILKRFGESLVTVFIVIFAVFMLMRFMPVEGYFTREDFTEMTAEARQVYLQSIGISGNPFGQFGRFLSGLAVGDWGRSITVYPKTPIASIIAEKAGYSLAFGLSAIGISIVFGLALGIAMAQNKDRLVDSLGTLYVVVVRAIPSLIYLFLIQIWVSGILGWPMVFYADVPVSWILPTVSMALPGIAWYAIWLRRFMVDEENKDYIKFAISKGLPRKKVMTGHVLRNAAVPLVQYLPTQILLTIAGSLIIESMYSIPGLGGLLVYAIRQQDNPLVQALVLLFSVLGIFGVFLGDILMVLIDPRIKLEGTSRTGDHV
ncbi:MAG: ABC transporter permease [Spirochaetales bacterium]|nr:ABC transporter permease [Spirochaetales bacterium]